MTREGDQQGGYGGAFFDPVTGKPVDTSQWEPGSGSIAPQAQPYTDPYGQQAQASNQPPFQQDPYQQQAYAQPQFHQGQYQHDQYQQAPYSAAGFPLPPQQSGTGQQGRQPNTRLMTIISVSVGVVVLLVIGFVLLGKWQGGEEGNAKPKAAPPPSTSSSRPSAPSTSGPTTTAPAVSGWQGVLDDQDGLAYDVPAKWNIAEHGMLTGYEKPDKDAPFGAKPYITGHSSAKFRGDCTEKNAHRAQTVVVKAGDLDPTRAAGGAAMMWLKGANMDKKGKTPNPKPPKPGTIKLQSGKRAPIASVSGKSLDQSGKCHAPSTRVTAVGIKAGKQTRVLVVENEEHVPKGVDTKTVRKIAGSLRPAG